MWLRRKAGRASAHGTQGGRGPVRVAAVSDAVYPWNIGGKEIRQHELYRRYTQRGLEVRVYTMHWWDSSATTFDDAGGMSFQRLCRLLPLYSGGRRSIRQGLIFAAASLGMLAHDFDVLEADSIPFLHLFPLKLVSVLKRRPLVVTWHEYWGTEYWRAYLGPLGLIAAAVERLAVSLPDHVFAASHGTARRILAAGRKSSTLTVIPNGIDLPAVDRIPTAGPESAADLVVVGRLLEHKNVHVAVRALRLLRDRGHQLTMQVVGRGPAEQKLHALTAALGLTDHITFTPEIDHHEDVLATIRAARVLVFPTVREGFGMVALEALACGTPVVTCDHPDNFARDLIQPDVNGTLCQPSAESLADAIARVLDRNQELSTGARDSAQGYDWELIADQAAKMHCSLYQSAARPLTSASRTR